MTPQAEALKQAKEALEANHKWHQAHDEYDGYAESELCTQNLASLAALTSASDAQPVAPQETVQPSTPSSRWAENGEPDPHGNSYDCERAALTLGKLTDDELANAAFMNYDRRPSFQDIVDGKAHMPIVYMTAVKDRIRWLSRSLEKALASPAPDVSSEATGELLDLLREAMPIVYSSFEQPIKGQELAQRISAAIGAPMPTRGVNIGVYIDNNSED